ncbi:MAG: 50S ribosomal protein L32 [Clostridia bacterium]|nr:50S ribosomal protein L32 [Clostridia bacterium]
MAVPKRKTSKARRDKRRANWKLTAPALVRCSNCGSYKRPHRLCAACGMYDGRQVVSVEEE